MESDAFYGAVMSELLLADKITLNDEILVICGGSVDRDTLYDLGFEHVVISNLDVRLQEEGQRFFYPYEWDFQDAEELTYPDRSFDFVIVHSGLHHLRSPHRGIVEMYRVARKGIIGFEPYLSWFTKLGVKLGFGQQYEDAAVFYNECKYGGVANTEIPNYVYRFRKEEIISVINTLAPEFVHEFQFWHIVRLNEVRLGGLKSSYRYHLVRIAKSVLVRLSKRYAFFANNIAFLVRKPAMDSAIHPWLRIDDGEITINREWLENKYDDTNQ